ncbi:MAG: esterase family protein [Chloroflexota bacterium]|nr:esterase family protein [Chloroflexota bacterium]
MKRQAVPAREHQRGTAPRRQGLLVLPLLAIITVVAATSVASALDGGSPGASPPRGGSPGSGSTAALPTAIPLRPGVSDLTIPSAALGRDMPAQVFVPRDLDSAATHPVLYLFHGRYGSERGWMGGSFGRAGVGVHDIAQALIDEGRIPPLIIVSALINDSYGVDSPPTQEGYDHGPYERYILDDLIPTVESRFPISADPADRAIGGLSMGGFAALHAAFRYPERFGGVAGLSPAVFEGMLPDRQWLYPTAAARQEHDPLLLAESADIDHLRVFLGAGRADYLWIIQATDVLADRLGNRGVRVTATNIRGSHDTPTWQRLAPQMLLALYGDE